MSGFLRGVLAEITGPTRVLARWMRRHPRLSAALASIVALYITGWIMAPAAHAAGGGDATADSYADHLISSAGIRASHYSSLFINRGDVFSADKSIWSMFVDIVWGVHFWLVTTAIDTFTWLLGFSWVDIIAVPLEGLSTLVTSIIAQFGVIPFAVFLSAAVAAFLLLRGKIGKAVVEVVTVAVIFAAASGFLAAPVQWITSDGGPLEVARDGGAQLSAAILRGDGDVRDVSSIENPVGETIIAPLIDLFVVYPAEAISFGHVLTGDCAETVDEAVLVLDPVKRDTNAIRDAVGTCDADAKTWADNTNMPHLSSAIGVLTGSAWIMVFAWLISVVLMLSVAVTLWMGLTTSWRVVFAMFPWTNRAKLFYSVGGMFAGAFFLISSQVALSAFLWLITTVMPLIVNLGVPIGTQLNVLSTLGFIGIVLLLVMLWNHHRAAKRVADKLNGALESAGTKRDLMPVTGLPPSVRSIAQHHLGNRGLRKAIENREDDTDNPLSLQDSRSVNIYNIGGGPTTPADAPAFGGHYTATRSPQPSDPGGSGGMLALSAASQVAANTGETGAAAAKTVGVIAAGTRYAGALASGGVPGLAIAAAKDVASSVVARRISVNGKGEGTVARPEHATPSRAPRASLGDTAPTGRSRVVSSSAGPEHDAGRRISVASDGTGTVVHSATSFRSATPQPTTELVAPDAWGS